MIKYVLSACDYIKDISKIREALRSDDVEQLPVLPIPSGYDVHFCWHADEGTFFQDEGFLTVYAEKFSGEGKLVYRKLHGWNPDSVDIWLSGDALIVLNTTIKDLRPAGMYKAYHPYAYARADIMRVTIPIADDNLEEMVLQAKNTVFKGD